MSWQEILPNIFTWAVFSEEKGFNFNGYYVVTPEGSYVIDPPAPTEDVWQEMESRDAPRAIYLTNKDHTRKATELKERLNAPIWIHEADRDLAAIAIDQTFTDGQELPGAFRVIQLQHCKSEGESALLWQGDTNVLFIGDALIGNPPGELHLLPPAKVPEPAKAIESIQSLMDCDFDALLVGDGVSLPEGGRRALRTFLEGS